MLSIPVSCRQLPTAEAERWYRLEFQDRLQDFAPDIAMLAVECLLDDGLFRKNRQRLRVNGLVHSVDHVRYTHIYTHLKIFTRIYRCYRLVHKSDDPARLIAVDLNLGDDDSELLQTLKRRDTKLREDKAAEQQRAMELDAEYGAAEADMMMATTRDDNDGRLACDERMTVAMYQMEKIKAVQRDRESRPVEAEVFKEELLELISALILRDRSILASYVDDEEKHKVRLQREHERMCVRVAELDREMLEEAYAKLSQQLNVDKVERIRLMAINQRVAARSKRREMERIGLRGH